MNEKQRFQAFKGKGLNTELLNMALEKEIVSLAALGTQGLVSPKRFKAYTQESS